MTGRVLGPAEGVRGVRETHVVATCMECYLDLLTLHAGALIPL